MRKRTTLLALLAVTAVTMSACGEDQAAEQQESATRELQQAQRELREERRRLKREREKEEPTERPSSDESSSDTPTRGEKGRVPDVEGKDHQLAQDTMQAAGFYNLSEEDASGEDRPLIYDRNWTVVAQSPKAGARASLDRAIVLKAKKDGE